MKFCNFAYVYVGVMGDNLMCTNTNNKFMMKMLECFEILGLLEDEKTLFVCKQSTRAWLPDLSQLCFSSYLVLILSSLFQTQTQH